ncbi:novel putative transporter 1, putative [Plasmodium gallinaceum]|uniref:Novel putative transporter 1, putative n=1 Tax=Plasmodium gallinaceum TaxID=5849 RepID=A0A1J1GPT1_PLAGA|nr:novel putative transporter 1, putative [Plasmodium gallinaceum]CRG93303.1 novel putative transporter 1, putative [Plasmodium gallinaceum]
MKTSLYDKFVKGVKGLWLKSDPNLPGAKQKTPLNINRFYLLIIIIIYTSTSACIYFDWSAIRNLLLRAGKYEHLNTGQYSDITLSPQYKRINNLYPITLAIHFTTSVFCGFLFDHIGPKFTAILGQLFNIICWILLSIESTTVDTTFMGFVFLGLGADTAFIPILTVSNLYPDASTFILTVVGAAASLSFAVPATLNLIYNNIPNISFSYICYGYIFVILVPCLLVAIFLLPLRPFKGLDYYLEKENERTSHNLKDDNILRHNSINEIELGYIESLNKVNKEENDNPSTYDMEKNFEKMQNKTNYMSNGSTMNSSKSIMEGKDFHMKSIKLFFKILISYPSMCVISYFILFNISTVFYGMVNETYFYYDRSIINIINILLPASCIPCIIFGRFVNKYGAALIILVMNAFSALMHITALIKHKAAGLISVFLYMCVTSMYTSQIYCFIQNSFPSIVFGKLLGFASLCGGTFSLICELLYDSVISTENTSIDPTNVALLLVICFLIMFLPLSILYVRKYERSIENTEESDK